MRASDRGVHRKRPINDPRRVGRSGQLRQHLVPGALRRQAVMPGPYRLPRPEDLRQIAPRDPAPVPVDDRLYHRPRVGELPPRPTRGTRQHPLDQRPLRIRKHLKPRHEIRLPADQLTFVRHALAPEDAGAPGVEQRVLELRRTQRRGQDWIGPELGIPARTVSAILRRHQVPYLRECDPPTGEVIRASKTTAVRYEHAHPGSLVHMDVKKIGRIPDGGGWRTHGREPPVTSLTATAATNDDARTLFLLATVREGAIG